jgi:hypothetical protein
MRENGLTMKNMARALYNIPMAPIMRGSGKTVERVDKERLLMHKKMSMPDLGLMIRDMVKV